MVELQQCNRVATWDSVYVVTLGRMDEAILGQPMVPIQVSATALVRILCVGTVQIESGERVHDFKSLQ